MNPIASRASRLSLALAALGIVGACAPPQPPAPLLPAVFVTQVRNDSGAAERVLFGSLRPRIESELAFRTGGKVTARLVELGQSVRAGQALARIDPADYQLAVHAAADQQRAAEVDAVQAASDAARFKRLLADGSVGGADQERQQARADAAAARLALAQRQLDLARNRAGYAVLRAPFEGVVTSLGLERGQMVSEGQSVLSLARPGEWEVQADVPEALAASLESLQAFARIGERSASDVKLRLRELAPSASAQTRSYRARFAIASAAPTTEWRIGMSAELRLARTGGVAAAELPLSALLTTGQQPAVWLADATTGALMRQPVQLLSQTTDHVRLGGLADGALVVSVGAQKLDGGLKVQPMLRPLSALASAQTR